MKRLILMTSPPACGKNYVSRALCKKLHPMTYLDKDTLIIMSRKIFEVGNAPFDRSSSFFYQYVRDVEYECVLALALEALEYSDTVLINAPFTHEIRSKTWMHGMRAQLAEKGAILTVVFVVADPEIVHQRMLLRKSDRDTWKLEHWDEYNAGVDYSIPTVPQDRSNCDEFFVINNNSDEAMQSNLDAMVEQIRQMDQMGLS